MGDMQREQKRIQKEEKAKLKAQRKLDKEERKRKKSFKNRKVKRRIRLALKVVGIIILCLIIIGLILAGLVWTKIKPLFDEAKATAYEKIANIDSDTFMMLENTEIYDVNGEKLGEINISNYEYVDINDISKFIQDGYIAVEDKNFETHNGIDYKALLRAGLALIKNKGQITQGGSTITQQVLKNNVIGTDISKWERKLLEFFLAPELEKEFSKSQIMEFYCNSNYYNNGCYGVEAASKYYFGKTAKQVSLAEAALLVGLSNNPEAYNPVTKPDAAVEKRHFVLTQMLEEGKITQEQFNVADAEELTLVLEREERVKESYQVSFALHCAALKIMENDGFDFKYTFQTQQEYDDYKTLYDTTYSEAANKVRNGGYIIETSLDPDKQGMLQEVVDSTLSVYQEKAEDGRYQMQGSATVVDNSTGYVVAIVGGRGTEDEYNRGYQAYRQPGSAAKPIVAYTPAFETGLYYPSLIVKDEPIEDGPENANRSYRGNVSIREAIVRSINTIPYKILGEIGVSTGLRALDKMQFSGLSFEDTYNSSLAIGGFTYGTTTFEMAKAYQTLVDSGSYSDANCIKKITYQNGDIIYDGTIHYSQVYTADASYIMIDCLKDVISEAYGTGYGIEVPGQIIAGKTGTTDQKKDGWFCGMSKYYTVAVWCGYDMPKVIPDMAGSTYPGQIFEQAMIKLHEDLPEADFEKPNTIIEAYVNWRGERVTYNSGRTELFSAQAITELETKQREEEEKAKAEQAAKEAEAEAEKVTSIKLEIEQFAVRSVSTIDELNSFDSDYYNLRNKIYTIKDAGTESECLETLQGYYDRINELDVVEQLRAEKEEAERKAAEEEARRKQEEAEKAAQLKLERIEAAEAAIEAVKSHTIFSDKDINSLLDEAKEKIEACKSYGEYDRLKQELNELDEMYRIESNPNEPESSGNSEEADGDVDFDTPNIPDIPMEIETDAA